MKKKEAREILGVKEDDDENVIKKAYRKLALKNHPDKNKGSEESKVKFQRISEAYKCLTDPKYMDESMDGMEGFSMDEEELFAMFNMMFGFEDMMFGGNNGGGGGSLFDFLDFMEGGGGLGGMMGGMGMFDLPNVEDLTPSEMKVAEDYVNNGDEEGLFIYLQELKSKINKREKTDFDSKIRNKKNKNTRRNNNHGSQNVSRNNSSENKLKSDSRFEYFNNNVDSSDDGFEDSDEERAQMEAFAAMVGMPPSMVKEMMNDDEMLSYRRGGTGINKNKKYDSVANVSSKAKRNSNAIPDDELKDFAAMMGIPLSLARQMLMEEMGITGGGDDNFLHDQTKKKGKKKRNKMNSGGRASNMVPEEVAFENFMMNFESTLNADNSRKSFEEEVLSSLMSEMEFEDTL
jgi:hypothetical protein